MSRQWGKGGEFPWDNTLATFIEPKDDYDVLRTAIQMILFTRKGERVMVRDFGSNLHEKVFDPNDKILRNTIMKEIKEAIRRWDDRIGIASINITQVEHDFKMVVVFYNAKDPLKTTRSFSVSLGVIRPGAVS